MSAHACCSFSSVQGVANRERAKASDCKPIVRARELGSWIGPSAVLVFLPKCPMCLAAYLAVAGIGISAQAAAGLRVGIMATCAAALAYVASKSLLASRAKWMVRTTR